MCKTGIPENFKYFSNAEMFDKVEDEAISKLTLFSNKWKFQNCFHDQKLY